MTQENKQVRENYITPAFRLSYPSLFEPIAVMGNEAKKKYFATMLFPKKETVAALVAAQNPAAKLMAQDNLADFWARILRVARGNFGPEVDLKSLKLTKFRDGDKPKESTGKTDENEKGYIVLRTSSNAENRPDCIDQSKKRITDQSQLYPGCWCRAVLTIAPFLKPQRGVTIYLVGIQKLADDVTFSSRPRVEDEFDAVGAEGAITPDVPANDMPWDV